MRARRTVAGCPGALIAAVVPLCGDAAIAQRAAVSACTSPFDLTNGSFETPDVGAFEIADQSRVTGWHTTEPDGGIEIWQTGYLGVPAAAGEQFAELSANQRGELYQDRATTPGSRLSYAVSHRGRSGIDTMQIRIGPPGGPPNLTRIVSTGDASWRSVFGAYTVIDYSSNATNIMCASPVGPYRTAAGATPNYATGAVLGCNPDITVWGVGTRTIWNPVPNLDIGLEVVYTKIETSHEAPNLLLNRGVLLSFGGAGGRAGGLYRPSSEEVWSGIFRWQRNFWP